MHILCLDEDIITLNKEGLTLSSLDLEDIYLLDKAHLIVPVADKLIPFTENNLKLRTYLIYLSYLYNINFLDLYQIDLQYSLKLISSLQISENIKRNLYNLQETNKGKYFSTYIEELNNSEYRDSLRIDQKRLQRSVKKKD